MNDKIMDGKVKSGYNAQNSIKTIHLVFPYSSSGAEYVRLFARSEHGIVVLLHGLGIYLVGQCSHHFLHIEYARGYQGLCGVRACVLVGP